MLAGMSVSLQYALFRFRFMRKWAAEVFWIGSHISVERGVYGRRMNRTRFLVPLLAAAGVGAPAVALAQETTPTTIGLYYRTCADAPHQLLRGDPGYRPALDGNNDGVACEDRPPRTTTSIVASTTTSTTVAMMTVCIQGVTTTVPVGATNPTGAPYVPGPCPDEPPRRTICLSGIKTITVTREEEDTIGEPYTLGPCPAKITPRFTG